MICPFSGLHYHVVHIYLDISVNHVMEQSSSSSLISGSCILQPKWHNQVAVSTPLGNERSLLHILWSHHNLIIPRKSFRALWLTTKNPNGLKVGCKKPKTMAHNLAQTVPRTDLELMDPKQVGLGSKITKISAPYKLAQ